MEAIIDELRERPFGRPVFDPQELRKKIALIAEDGEPVGIIFGEVRSSKVAHVNIAYVVPERRREGIGKALLAEFAKRGRAGGAEHVTLDVDKSNEPGRAIWQRLGFHEWALRLFTPIGELESRLAATGPAESRASLHVQTDDVDAVRAAAEKYLPRFGGADPSVAGPENGWTTVTADLLDRDRHVLGRLASELSNATSAVVCTLALEDGQVVRYVLYERGSVVDEYQSLPEYYGPIAPGDVVALAANATVVSRLTGADPARVRALARTASSPDELPPGPELLQQLAELLGVPG
jgi:hypothetical protein